MSPYVAFSKSRRSVWSALVFRHPPREDYGLLRWVGVLEVYQLTRWHNCQSLCVHVSRGRTASEEPVLYYILSDNRLKELLVKHDRSEYSSKQIVLSDVKFMNRQTTARHSSLSMRWMQSMCGGLWSIV